MSEIREGEAFVAGTGPEAARDLLAKAKDAGLSPSVVRTHPDGGFIVPAELVKKPATRAKSTKSAKGKE
jgi:hypothetical protein